MAHEVNSGSRHMVEQPVNRVEDGPTHCNKELKSKPTNQTLQPGVPEDADPVLIPCRPSSNLCVPDWDSGCREPRAYLIFVLLPKSSRGSNSVN